MKISAFRILLLALVFFLLTSVQVSAAQIHDLSSLAVGLKITGQAGGMFLDSLIDPPYLYQITPDSVRIYQIPPFAQPALIHVLKFNTRINNLDKFSAGGKDYLVVVGDYLLAIVDITDPSDPRLAYRDSFNGGNDVEIKDDVMYVSGQYSEGINIYDISDPELPLYAGNYSYGNNDTRYLVVSGDYLFAGFGTNDNKVVSLDISNPVSPQYIDEIALSGAPGKMCIGQHENKLAVCASTGGLVLIEVTASGGFGVPNSFSFAGMSVRDVDRYGEYFLALFNPDQLRAYRVDSSGNITDSGYSSFSGGNLQSLDIEDGGSDIVIVDDFNTLRHMGIDNISPFILNSYGKEISISNVKCLEFSSDYIYAAGATGEFAVYSLASTTTPSLVYFDPAASSGFVDMELSYTLFEPSHLYLADDSYDIYSYSLADPQNPVLLDIFTCPAKIYDIELRSSLFGSSYLYAALSNGNIYIIDITDPSNLSLYYNLTSCDYTRDIYSRYTLNFPYGEHYYLYVADGWSGFKIFNMDDPSNPILLDNYDPIQKYFSEVAAYGDIAYVIDNYGWCNILDCSDSLHISWLKSISGLSSDHGEANVSAGFLSLPSGWRFYNFDISQPATPVVHSYVSDLGAKYEEIETAGDGIFYAANTDAGIEIITTATAATRIYGHDRVETAIEVSRKTSSSKATTVVVATALNWPDALCAAPLANAMYSPVLLAYKNSVPSSVIKEIRRLRATDVCVVGGPAAISDDVVSQLESEGFNVERIWGETRYETAVEVAKKMAKVMGVNGFFSVCIATGENYPDALAISELAALLHEPVLLVHPGGVPSSVQEFLSDYLVSGVYIAGGNAAVPDSVISQLPQTVLERFAGSNRYETASLIADKTKDVLGFPPGGVFIATGENYPDALAGSLGAIQSRSVLLLVHPSRPVNSFVKNWMKANPEFKMITVLGGPQAVSDQVMEELKSINP